MVINPVVMEYEWLVGGLEPWNFMTFHILGMSSSQLTNSCFSEGLKPPTSKWWSKTLGPVHDIAAEIPVLGFWHNVPQESPYENQDIFSGNMRCVSCSTVLGSKVIEVKHVAFEPFEFSGKYTKNVRSFAETLPGFVSFFWARTPVRNITRWAASETTGIFR